MKKEQILIAATAAATLLLSGCNSTTTASDVDSSFAGVLTDSPVAGATYECGATVDTTDANGSFECDTLPVSFYVGGVKLGEIDTLPADGNVTPQDLAGVSRDSYTEEVEKIAVFLQSLDDDGDINETITLDNDVIAELERVHAELQEMAKQEMLEMLDAIGAMRVVTEEEAIKHLQAHMPPCMIDETNQTLPQEGREWGHRHQEQHRGDLNDTVRTLPFMPGNRGTDAKNPTDTETNTPVEVLPEVNDTKEEVVPQTPDEENVTPQPVTPEDVASEGNETKEDVLEEGTEAVPTAEDTPAS